METEAYPVGEPVTPGGARWPAPTTIDGSHVRLEPLDVGRHGEALFRAASGVEHAALWAYLADGPFTARHEFDTALERKAAATDAVFLSLVDPVSGDARGYASYMRIDVPNRVVEVGNVLFTPALQGTTAATEAMYLMARHAFEALGYRRYEWKCNALNEPSKRAAARLGFTYEGTFRQHMIVKGRNRDTAWYSMLDTEWPARKAAFERWLCPDNFDADGRQRMRLEACRRAV